MTVIKKEVLGAEEELNEPEKDGDVMELSDTEEDSAPRIVAPDPGAPTDQEIEDHRIDHIPYRCWCEHCVRGRGTGEQHRGGPCTAISTFAFDYLFVTKQGVKTRLELRDAEILLKILVA